MDFAKNKYVWQQEYDKLDLLRLMCRRKNLWKAVFTENDEIKRVLFLMSTGVIFHNLTLVTFFFVQVFFWIRILYANLEVD